MGKKKKARGSGAKQFVLGYVGYVPHGGTMFELLKPRLLTRGTNWSRMAKTLGMTRQNLCAQLGQPEVRLHVVHQVLEELGDDIKDYADLLTIDESREL